MDGDSSVYVHSPVGADFVNMVGIGTPCDHSNDPHRWFLFLFMPRVKQEQTLCAVGVLCMYDLHTILVRGIHQAMA